MHADLATFSVRLTPTLVTSIAGMLFDWLYPAHFPTIIACLEAWAGERLEGRCRLCLPVQLASLCSHLPTDGSMHSTCPAAPSPAADTPEVTTALLKFMAEFALNKTQRLTFDSSSPNGILLFREVSKVGWAALLMFPLLFR